MGKQPLAKPLAIDAPVTMEYLSPRRAVAALASNRLLALATFAPHNPTIPSDARQFTVGLTPTADSQWLEAWWSADPVRSGSDDGIRFSRNDRVVFGHYRIDLTRDVDVAAATAVAYGKIRAFVQRHKCPHIFRIWNYIPDIARVESGIERYQAFCVGRHSSVCDGEAFENALPAASAIGTHACDLQITFMAADTPARQIENPRQVSAFRYPRQYGPRSPSFSRAVLMEWDRHFDLYISGTASIVGHESRHRGDIGAQFEETVRNLDALVDNARAGLPHDTEWRGAFSALKAYVRTPEHLASVRTLAARRFGHELPILFLIGDICRADLLLEIEGIYRFESLR